MRAQEFLIMMEQDLETHSDKEQLIGVLEVMREALKNSLDIEIDDDKNVEKCFNFMRDYAQKHKSGNSYYMGPTVSLKVVSDYLGVKNTSPESPMKEITSPKKIVNINDFLD